MMVAVSGRRRMTLEQFDALREEPGTYHDLLEGELFVLSNPHYYDQEICMRLVLRLDSWCHEHTGEVCFHVDWELFDDTVLCPDVFYVSS